MRKASRLFEIIQILRLSPKPVTAAIIAERLEVTVRSIYRDIAALQAMRVPIEGGRGIGYILRPGFDMPPLMFSIEETEAIVLALALLARSNDTELKDAAARVSDKIAGAMPAPLRQTLNSRTLHAWGSIAPAPESLDLALVRRAIRDERKLLLDYSDEQGRGSQRAIRPLALIYYSATAVVVGWCELRQAIRNFRTDRVQGCALLEAHFRGEGDGLRDLWISGWKQQPAGPLAR
ncbi:putative DNA-binding transcriptional regulator YafY [Pararhizobium capsulatum DSM 1112]|uniref:DNA-binding transcriptional regulator YafY n=1 Tax=Pararhizobium capsulatum DSM 1112 TaxID=1121113 RepID=A0ABU0BMQ8_9HYPH|nr:YafY family protein [Pararhizobium capsulatum]MDQ0319545.1 putative DNA-binding transcriptional regulator YafY [Pararhizobium capsulatum DSM 1112]